MSADAVPPLGLRKTRMRSAYPFSISLHAADGPFGIAVVEAMAAGCVPIVQNMTVAVETVPFDELRFDT